MFKSFKKFNQRSSQQNFMLIVWFYVDKIFKVLKESLIELSPLRSQTPFTWKIFPSENLPTFQSNSIYSASLEKKKGKKERKEKENGRKVGWVNFTRIITRIYTAFSDASF